MSLLSIASGSLWAADKWVEFLNLRLDNARLEDCSIAMHIQVSNLKDKTNDIISTGNIAELVTISMGYSALLPAQLLAGKLMRDGDLIAPNFGDTFLRAQGADVTIGALVKPKHLVTNKYSDLADVDVVFDDLRLPMSQINFRNWKALINHGYQQTLVQLNQAPL